MQIKTVSVIGNVVSALVDGAVSIKCLLLTSKVKASCSVDHVVIRSETIEKINVTVARQITSILLAVFARCVVLTKKNLILPSLNGELPSANRALANSRRAMNSKRNNKTSKISPHI